MAGYDHKKIEGKWQKEWAKKKVYKTEDASKKPKFFILDMFPYPSGEGLHVGHPKGYIATDIVSRMKRMQGHNVLHPMGFDAFGLPAENYAIKTKTNPMVSVKKNVARYKKQLEILGFDYDWSREVNTTDPKFYKWTQWIFAKLYERGLAYESFEPINWCPSCKTGLANEDVEDGKCERCGTVVEKKPMRQWVLRITDYADRLLSDLDTLDWPDSIKESQRNWIGRSEGAEIDFKVKDKDLSIKVFTTRPDTLFGVTYVVLAPESSVMRDLLKQKETIKNRDEVIQYIASAKNKTEIERTDAKKEKTGVRLDGVMGINPVNNEGVPIFVADYVLAEYGTGAVMAVPAHDERDFVFARKFGLPIKHVIEPKFMGTVGDGAIKEGLPFVKRNAVAVVVRNPKDNTYLCNSWKSFKMHGLFTGGLEDNEDPVEGARREILEETGYKNLKFVRKSSIAINTYFYHRMKGQNRHAHFTFVFFDLENEDRAPVDEKEAAIHEIVWKKREELKNFFTVYEGSFILNILDNDEYVYTESGILSNSGKFNELESDEGKKKITEAVGGKWVVKYKLKDWVFSRQRYWGEPFPIVKDGDRNILVPEKELPVELPKVKSYEPTGTGESPLAAIDKWVNVKIGKKMLKRETNTMPQWAGSSWYYLRYMDPLNRKALVGKKEEKYWNQVDFYVGGAEHATRHLIYARFWHKFLYDIGAVSTIEPFKKLQSVGLIMGEDGRKMSKRFGNVVNPDEIVATYGADTLRVYEMFMGPFDQAIPWSTKGIIGSRRFLERIWNMKEKVDKKATLSKEAEILLHKTIAKVTDDMAMLRHNTAVSSLMILSNELEKAATIPKDAYESLLKLLAPLAPHVSEELWRALGNKKSVHIAHWPVADASKTVEDDVLYVVQVNGKVRGSFKIPKTMSKETIESMATRLEEVKKWIGDKKPEKVIVVPGKLVSIVVK